MIRVTNFPSLADISISCVPNPHIEMPENIKGDYEEARSIASKTPRSAAALLKFSIQNLTQNLFDKEAGKDLNGNIKKLFEKGLPEKIRKAFDFLLVIGNNAVPSGLIDLMDDR